MLIRYRQLTILHRDHCSIWLWRSWNWLIVCGLVILAILSHALTCFRSIKRYFLMEQGDFFVNFTEIAKGLIACAPIQISSIWNRGAAKAHPRHCHFSPWSSLGACPPHQFSQHRSVQGWSSVGQTSDVRQLGPNIQRSCGLVPCNLITEMFRIMNVSHDFKVFFCCWIFRQNSLWWCRDMNVVTLWIHLWWRLMRRRSPRSRQCHKVIQSQKLFGLPCLYWLCNFQELRRSHLSTKCNGPSRSSSAKRCVLFWQS